MLHKMFYLTRVTGWHSTILISYLGSKTAAV